MKRLALLASLLFSLCLVVSAADFAGDWTAESHLANGTVIPYALTIKTDGNTVSGTLHYAKRAAKTLDEGAIHGDEISFTVTEMSEAGPYKMFYKAKMEGAQLHLVGEREGKEGKLVKGRDLSFTRK